jgi:hypothetical protein
MLETSDKHNQKAERQKEQFIKENGGRLSGLEDDSEFAADDSLPIMGAGPTNRSEYRPMVRSQEDNTQMEERTQVNSTLGWTALVLAIVSLFLWPTLTASAAIVIGILSYFQGNRSLATWSIVIGLVSLLSFFFIVPYYS